LLEIPLAVVYILSQKAGSSRNNICIGLSFELTVRRVSPRDYPPCLLFLCPYYGRRRDLRSSPPQSGINVIRSFVVSLQNPSPPHTPGIKVVFYPCGRRLRSRVSTSYAPLLSPCKFSSGYKKTPEIQKNLPELIP